MASAAACAFSAPISSRPVTIERGCFGVALAGRLRFGGRTLGLGVSD